MRSASWIVVLFLVVNTNALAQKKKVVYLDTLGNTSTLMKHLSVLYTGRYVDEIDDHNSTTRYVKPRPVTALEFDSILRKTEEKIVNKNLMDKQASGFNVTDLNGKTYDLQSLRGKVVVLNFWFVGCGPCEVEMPELNQLVERYRASPDIVFLSFCNSKESKIKKFLRENEFDYPVAIMTGDIGKVYQLRAFPTNVIIGKNGQCSFASTGIGRGGVHILQNHIEEALRAD